LPRVRQRLGNVICHQPRRARFIVRDKRRKNLAMLSHNGFGARALVNIQTTKSLNLFPYDCDQARQPPITGGLGERAMKARTLHFQLRLIAIG
jgi:hypothetical protein